ncbi:hypothetical protein P4233_01065 [Pseudomonas aeruginosa]|nr:hypothetical protein [Pseudomonas aeruginosa]
MHESDLRQLLEAGASTSAPAEGFQGCMIAHHQLVFVPALALSSRPVRARNFLSNAAGDGPGQGMASARRQRDQASGRPRKQAPPAATGEQLGVGMPCDGSSMTATPRCRRGGRPGRGQHDPTKVPATSAYRRSPGFIVLRPAPKAVRAPAHPRPASTSVQAQRRAVARPGPGHSPGLAVLAEYLQRSPAQHGDAGEHQSASAKAGCAVSRVRAIENAVQARRQFLDHGKAGAEQCRFSRSGERMVAVAHTAQGRSPGEERQLGLF